MIKNQDRSGWFGASDTHFIMGNWNTKTFYKWWAVKCGIIDNNFTTKAMQAGTHYEHRILDALNIPNLKKDKQIRKKRYLLRVNLDGNTRTTIHEVKTYGGEFRLSKAYCQQVQVQMWAVRKRKAFIDSYQLTDDDYVNFFNPIDENRLHSHQIEYDEGFIKSYLPRLKYLAKCLRKGKVPNEAEYQKTFLRL